MTRALIYDIASGVAVQTMTADKEADIASAIDASQGYVIVGADEDDATHYVKGGVAVPYPAKPVAVPVEWNPATEAWIDPRPPAKITQDLAADARDARNAALLVCDWTQLSDVPMDANLRKTWQVYRQALRDVPQQKAFPDKIQWPVFQ